MRPSEPGARWKYAKSRYSLPLRKGQQPAYQIVGCVTRTTGGPRQQDLGFPAGEIYIRRPETSGISSASQQHGDQQQRQKEPPGARNDSKAFRSLEMTQPLAVKQLVNATKRRGAGALAPLAADLVRNPTSCHKTVAADHR